MKKVRNILSIIALSIAFVGCEKETMDYEGTDAIYFDVQYGADWGNENFWIHQYYSVVSFGELSTNEYDGNLKINIAGDIKDYDRPFKVEIVADSTTAIVGEEIEFSEDQVIKAGEKLTRLDYKIKKSDRMSIDTLQVQFRLVPNEHFSLPFSEVGRIPGRWAGDPELEYNQNVDPTVHTLYMHNFVTQPEAWHFQFGDFSIKKYDLILEVTGLAKSDFNADNRSIMTSGGRWKFITAKVSEYLIEQYKKGREHWVIDEDGTMMYVAGVSWAKYTRPENMVQN